MPHAEIIPFPNRKKEPPPPTPATPSYHTLPGYEQIDPTVFINTVIHGLAPAPEPQSVMALFITLKNTLAELVKLEGRAKTIGHIRRALLTGDE